MVQKGFHQGGVGLGRVKLLGVLAPEGDVAGGRPRPVPRPQRLGHLHRGFPRLSAGEPFHLADLGAGELVPPPGQFSQVLREPF